MIEKDVISYLVRSVQEMMKGSHCSIRRGTCSLSYHSIRTDVVYVSCHFRMQCDGRRRNRGKAYHTHLGILRESRLLQDRSVPTSTLEMIEMKV